MRDDDMDEVLCELLGGKQVQIIALTEVGCEGSWHLINVRGFNPSMTTVGLGKGTGAALSVTGPMRGEGESVSVYSVELCTD